DDRPDDEDRQPTKGKGRGDADGDDDEGADDVRALDAAKRTGARPAGFFSIYKKGQGYWTRMGTLIGVALVGGLLAWTLYSQIPQSFFNTPFADERAAEAAARASETKIATLTSEVADPAKRLTPAEVADREKGLAAERKSLLDQRATIAQMAQNRTETGRRVAMAIAGTFLAVYVFFAIRLMNKPSNVDFLIATDTEMKKVNWTSRKELIGSSKVVILFMVLIAIFLFLNDTVWGFLMWALGVLRLKPPPFT
ncbi:MAG TPA: preprotein translocase subunit SecE, partial [Humisphaera sp.]